MTEHQRIPREWFADRCTCGGQYIGGECTGCGTVEVRDA